MKTLLLILALGLTTLAPRSAHAFLPDEVLSDPALEARARALSKGLRCVVCRNQSIDDSNADLARDLRVLLRERLVAGDTDAEALQFLVDRYGAYVLLKPPLEPQTYLLWLGPGLVLLAAALGFSQLWSRRAGDTPAVPGGDISDEDRAFLSALLESETLK